VAGHIDRSCRAWTPVTKTRASAATLPLLPALRQELLGYRARSAELGLGRIRAAELVCVTANGKPHHRRNAHRAVTNGADAAGLNGEGLEPLGVHDLRHSLVANAFEPGLSPAEFADLARHRTRKSRCRCTRG
jgi:integrase